jgi:hypothetical protein
MTNAFQKSRERIARQFDAGDLSKNEHARLSRAIDRAEARASEKKARAERRARQMVKARLRYRLSQALELSHARA